ncbi:MAG: hypothetical protein K2R98_06940 [Gemmataceae bacterium]|nr:hypothetical protein [Gemmataceae bacterium]
MADPKPLDDDEREELISYLDGEADAATAREVEAKLNRDPRVRAEADALRRTFDLLDFLPKPEPSANFTERTVTRVAAIPPGLLSVTRTRWRRWALGIGWAAALLVASVAGYAAAPMFHKSPPSTEPVLDVDQLLARDLRVIEQLRLYQPANDIYLLHELDRPELFGDEHAGH